MRVVEAWRVWERWDVQRFCLVVCFDLQRRECRFYARPAAGSGLSHSRLDALGREIGKRSGVV